MILSAEQISENLSGLAGWELADNQITKTFALKDFKSVMQLVNQIAIIAEQHQHHPDIDIRYNKVTFIVSTHSEGGITEKDFKLAQEIEKAAKAS